MDARGTREHIVRAADELFYKQGFEHTSFADVAHAVGISRGNFYYHFKTKDEILAAVIGAEPDRDSCNLVMMVATMIKNEDAGSRTGNVSCRSPPT